MKDRIIEIGKDSIWYLSSNAAYALIGFIALPILTRIFNPHDYGIFTLVNTAIIMGSTVFYGYLTTSIIRFYPEYEIRDELDVFYSTSLHYTPHFLALFLAILLPVAAFVLPLGKYRLLICLAIVTLALFTLFNVILAIYRARQKAWQFAVFTIIMQTCRYLLGAGLAVWLKAGVAGPFWGWMGALLILVPVELIALRIWKDLRWKKNSRDLQRELFKFGLAMVFVRVLSEVLASADRYMIQGFKGAYQVGLYSVVYNLVSSIEGMIVIFLSLAAMPVIMKVYEREGEENARALIKSITRYFLILLVPMILGIWVIRDPLVGVITTQKYMPATSAFLPLLTGIFFGNIAWLPLLAFLINKNTKMMLYPLASAAVVNILLNLVLIPRYGFQGAAWATFIAYLIYFAISTVMGTRAFRWDFPWIGAVKVFLATGVMGASLFGLEKLHMHGWQGLVALIAAAIVIYFVTFLALKGFSTAEIAYALDLAGRVPAVGGMVTALRERWRRQG